MTEKNKGGRPPHFNTPEEMQDKIDQYFKETDPKRVTVTGLCLYLGFADRCSLIDYGRKDEFSHTVKRAKTKVEYEYEQSLREHGRAGDMFALKNFGWSDKHEVDNTSSDGSMKPTVIQLVGKDES